LKLKPRFALPAALLLAVGIGAGAFAATSAPAVNPNVDTVGIVGYSALENGNNTYFTHMGGQFGMGDPQYNVDNPQIPFSPAVGTLLSSLHFGTWVPFFNPLGITVSAAREQLCGGTSSFDRGTAIEELIVPDSATTYDVVAIQGVYAPNGGDPCMSAVILTGEAAIVLRHVPDRDTVKLDLLFDGFHAHNGTFPGYASFIATDLSSPTANQVNSNHRVFPTRATGRTSEFYEAQNGLIGVRGGTPTSSLPSLIVPDVNFPNLVMKEAHGALNGNDIATASEVFGSFQSGAAWTVTPDVTEQGGNVITGAVSPYKSDHFSMYTAPGVFPAALS